MAAATAMTVSACIATTYVSLLSVRQFYPHRCVLRLINNHHCSRFPSVSRITPLLLSGSPSSLAINVNDSTSTASTIIRRMQLSCYSSETETHSDIASTPAITLDGEENSIREVANALDIRVGRILKAWRHEEADSLYVEEVDIGEPEPRTICSGLVKYISLHFLQDRNVIVLANLKPRNMRGVKSFGMLLAASDATRENVELLVPPEGAVPGERVWFGSVSDKGNLPNVASPNQVQKKKIWELVQPCLKTDDSCVATLGMHQMRTSAGAIVCESLKNANIS